VTIFNSFTFVFNLCEKTISRTDEGQPRPKYIFNKCGTNIYFFTLQRFGPSPSPNFKASLWFTTKPLKALYDWSRMNENSASAFKGVTDNVWWWLNWKCSIVDKFLRLHLRYIYWVWAQCRRLKSWIWVGTFSESVFFYK